MRLWLLRLVIARTICPSHRPWPLNHVAATVLGWAMKMEERLAWIESVRSPSHAYRREAEYLRLIESLEAELAAYKDAVKALEVRS